ncbi:uncharacterized protein LOC100821733 [Brachypodium distachyon]|uniref:Pectinesterase inhibitor domain-containing protein n=1 Tax=Brachypodium distachyon TaxID=15368 RepID=I1II49_BRADI|nr:uncharacterized protein LOC100821733 [Brachypodium distachyon]KQJ86601.1 hypothetical protein BRADI_4g06590v3 [Brachypodium distachyon]|eukprot:XP_003575489.1 uncharacterized protein LOC100821733 [Brachypodium distachyon]
MASSSALLVALLLFFISAVGSEAAAAPLEQLCANLGGFYVTPETCTSSLCVNSSCRSARDAPELATLAAGLAAANATAAKASLEAALASSPGKGPAEALRACLQMYGGAVPALQWAARAVAAGRHPGATAVLEAARYIAAGCAGVADGAAQLPAENEAFGILANVAHAVVASVSHAG